MRLTILTKPPKKFFNIFSFYLIYWLKRVIKKILFIPGYGPQAVLGSLVRGFEILKVDERLMKRCNLWKTFHSNEITD